MYRKEKYDKRIEMMSELMETCEKELHEEQKKRFEEELK